MVIYDLSTLLDLLQLGRLEEFVLALVEPLLISFQSDLTVAGIVAFLAADQRLMKPWIRFLGHDGLFGLEVRHICNVPFQMMILDGS